ncbi:hypothetical protein FXB39_05545 [Nocardioides sp. BGMRC 2183]|nr:hypothetical protein FXB39_05545 [Nocardioides sp. BGMRC 2183]
MMTPPPLLSGGLVGRDSELAVLDDLLLADGHPPPIAVVGTAGVGKTALVVEWARRNADRFPDGVLYCDLRGFSDAPPRSAQSVLPIFLRSLGASPSPEDDPGELFRAVAARRRVLVVLDNAASVDHVHPMLASGSGVRTVVTSRHSLSGLRALAGVEVLGLAPLQTADAASLLRDASIDLTPAVTEELAERCAGLPLALRIVAEQLRVRTGDAAGLLGELAVDNSPLESLDPGRHPIQRAHRAVLVDGQPLPGRAADLRRGRTAGRPGGRGSDRRSSRPRSSGRPARLGRAGAGASGRAARRRVLSPTRPASGAGAGRHRRSAPDGGAPAAGRPSAEPDAGGAEPDATARGHRATSRRLGATACGAAAAGRRCGGLPMGRPQRAVAHPHRLRGSAHPRLRRPGAEQPDHQQRRRPGHRGVLRARGGAGRRARQCRRRAPAGSGAGDAPEPPRTVRRRPGAAASYPGTGVRERAVAPRCGDRQQPGDPGPQQRRLLRGCRAAATGDRDVGAGRGRPDHRPADHGRQPDRAPGRGRTACDGAGAGAQAAGPGPRPHRTRHRERAPGDGAGPRGRRRRRRGGTGGPHDPGHPRPPRPGGRPPALGCHGRARTGACRPRGRRRRPRRTGEGCADQAPRGFAAAAGRAALGVRGGRTAGRPTGGRALASPGGPGVGADGGREGRAALTRALCRGTALCRRSLAASASERRHRASRLPPARVTPSASP